jgi:glucose dehydrogenase
VKIPVVITLCLGLLLTGAIGFGQDEAAVRAVEPAESRSSPASAPVTARRIVNADKEPGNWLTHGRTYSEQRFSPLKQINDQNVGELGLAWHYDFGTKRGLEATPLVIDGVMYVTGNWSVVHALDAKTGEHLWQFDPEVDPAWAPHLCCDVVNRGVAAWDESMGSAYRRPGVALLDHRGSTSGQWQSVYRQWWCRTRGARLRLGV